MQIPDEDLQRIDEAKKELLERAEGFEVMVNSKGWEFIKGYYENRVRAFATNLLTSEKPITEFTNERNELIGIKKLLGQVTEALKVLYDEREKQKAG